MAFQSFPLSGAQFGVHLIPAIMEPVRRSGRTAQQQFVLVTYFAGHIAHKFSCCARRKPFQNLIRCVCLQVAKQIKMT